MDQGYAENAVWNDSMTDKTILVVDDDSVTRELLKEVLEADGFLVAMASSGEEAMKTLRAGTFLVLSDIRMLGFDGLELLGRVRAQNPGTFVILMTGFGSMEGAVRAIQEGAYDYISKPFRIQDLKSLVSRAYRQWSLLGSSGLSKFDENATSKKSLIGKSASIVEVYKSLARAALSQSPVSILGETGTGKELVARAIHENSSRRTKKFQVVSCGSLNESQIEVELFGSNRSPVKAGLIEEAQGGTLFLDEIGCLSPGLQVKLLRLLQDGEFRHVDSSDVKVADVRIIAASRTKLSDLVDSGVFRSDLYYRLRVIEIVLPALRDRLEDLPNLASHFVSIYSKANGKRVSHISPEAMKLLASHAWQGNVRELENSIERAIAMSKSAVLFPEDFSGLADSCKEKEIAAGSLEQMEKDHILRVLQESQFNKSRASSVLGIDRATLYRKAQRYGIDLKSAER